MDAVLRALPFLLLLGLAGLFGTGGDAAGTAPPAVLTLDDRTEFVSLAGHLSAFHDTTAHMSLAEIEAAAAGGAFQPVEGAFNPGVDNSGVWWLRFSLRADSGSGGEWWLAVDAHPLTSMVDAWVPRRGPDGTIADVWRLSGMDVPPDARDLPVSLFTFRMDLPPDATQVIYLRMAGTRAIRAQIEVSRLPPLVGRIASVTTILSLMLGAAALLAVIAIAMGARLGERTLVLLGINTALMTVLQLIINGLTLPLMPGLSPGTLYAVHGATLYLTALTMILTIMGLFRGFRAMTWTRRFMQAFLVFTVVGLLLTPFAGYHRLLPVLLVFSILFCLLTIHAAYRWMRAGEPAGLWYFIGLSAYGVLLMAYAWRVLGFLPLTTVSAWVFPALVLGQILAIFIGITAAMQDRLRTRQALERDAMAALQQSEKALEVAVEARTRALQQENEARREAELALRQALRDQRNLLSMVSHEFRTPLSTIGAAAQVIRAGAQELGAQEERELGKITRAVARLGGLIDTFLAEEWLEHAALRLNLCRLDIVPLLTEVVRDSRGEAESPITLTGPAHLVTAVDPLLFRVAVGNLASNALKFGRAPVEITFGAADGAIRVSVADRGPGLDPGERDAIFDRYYRSPSHAALPGAGLGLFIVRRIAALHGGEVRLEDREGGGCVFILTLPTEPPPATA